jgi:hypothetical protein
MASGILAPSRKRNPGYALSSSRPLAKATIFRRRGRPQVWLGSIDLSATASVSGEVNRPDQVRATQLGRRPNHPNIPTSFPCRAVPARLCLSSPSRRPLIALLSSPRPKRSGEPGSNFLSATSVPFVDPHMGPRAGVAFRYWSQTTQLPDQIRRRRSAWLC